MRSIALLWPSALALVTAALTTGCFVDVHHAKSNDGGDSSPPPSSWSSDGGTDSIWPGAGTTACDAEGPYAQMDLQCYHSGTSTWLTSCDDGTLCRRVPVTVRYKLGQDLGTTNVVNVEAFDNPRFTGNPVSVMTLTGFDASHAGTEASDALLLKPGEYYFRAYLGDGTDEAAPYEYGDMQLVSETPVGLYGAASGPTRIVVAAPGAKDAEAQAPVDIVMDKLFKSDTASKTDARLRVMLQVDPNVDIPLGRKVIVELNTHDDFGFTPAYSFTVASEDLRVDGRKGLAELVTPELAEGTYFVRTFLDASGDGYADADELQAIFTQGGQKAPVKVVRSRTETLSLTLVKGG